MNLRGIAGLEATDSSDDSDASPSSVAGSSSIVTVLLQDTKTIVAALTAIGAKFDLTASEWLILDALNRYEELSMAELSQHAMASGATLTRAVDRLVSRALVYREASAVDRRKIQVHLSARGAALHEQMRPQVERVESNIRAVIEERRAGSFQVS